MSSKFSKIVGASALGALSTLDLMYSQQAIAVSTFSGSTVANPHGGSVQVSITVDGASGTYRITGISTPVQPTGANAAYSNLAIPTLTSEALAAQSASITAVSGASQISAAWISSLSAAIASAAAGGQRVGGTSITVAPTPTPTPTAPTTGTPAATTGSSTSGSTTTTNNPSTTQVVTFAPVTSTIPDSVGPAPSVNPIDFSAFSYIPPNYSVFMSQASNASSILSRITGTTNTPIVNSARAALSVLQSQMQSEQNYYAELPTSLNHYVANVNSQLAILTQQSNQAIADYYAKVQNAANKSFADSQNDANKLVLDAQAQADKLLADAKAQADKIVADAQAKADAIKALPAPTVTITATPKPQALTIALKPGAVIQKSFSCTKLYLGKSVTITVKDVSLKCPSGYSLSKKI